MEKKDNNVVAGLVHIEMLVDDPKASAEYMEDVFGAVRVEEEFANKISCDFDCECIHMQAGGVIFQLIKPDDKFKPELADWWKRDHLKSRGPFIHNITLMVNDADAFAKKIAKRGGTKMGKVNAITPDGKGRCDVHMYDTSDQCGMNVEFIQAPPKE